MTAARDVLQRLSALGARVECRGERLVLRPGKRVVPLALIDEARTAKLELLAMLAPRAFSDGARPPATGAGEHLPAATFEKPRISAALVEDAQMSAFDEHLRMKPLKALIEDDQVSAFEEPEGFCGLQPDLTSKMLNSPSLGAIHGIEHLGRDEWDEPEAERAAIVEHDGKIPREWAEGFARLDPDRPPGDVPAKRWQTFVDDGGRFLDSSFCPIAAALGWGSPDLFGCDRERPFARIDKCGLLWALNGDQLVALSQNTATIQTRTGARHTYRRKGSAPGRVLVWELVA